MSDAITDAPTRSAKDRLPSRELPVFFMHIAKTAGSYVNAVLAQALGSPKVATHIETYVGDSEDLTQALDAGATVLSGHVMLGLWTDISRPLGLPFRSFTVLREPVEHLASHILWFDHYNSPDRRQAYRRLDEGHQRVVDRIGAIDLTDAGQLDAFLTSLEGISVRFFDNCQSRYFLTAGRRDLDALRPLTLADARALRPAVDRFDMILRQDALDRDLARLGDFLGLLLSPLEERVNKAPSIRAIDTRHPLIRQVLSKRTLLDQWLWRSATGEAPRD